MSTHKTRTIKTSLLHKGFKQKNTDHEYFWLYVEGRKTSVRTRISFGVNEYDDSLLGFMARQLKLQRRELDDFISCPLTKEKYLEQLIKKGDVRLPQ